MSELKPCPFCGNKNPRIVHHFVNGIANLSHCFVRCNCGRGKTTASRKKEHGAIDEWNTRPIEDELRAEIASRDKKIAELLKVYGECKDAIARRDEIIARLKEDGERLASNVVTIIDEDGHTWCNACKNYYDVHSEYCPITLHRALMKELGNLPQPPEEGE